MNLYMLFLFDIIAGPNYETFMTKTAYNERLDKSDAQYVDIYHTNNGQYA
jgi:hypothetical protein